MPMRFSVILPPRFAINALSAGSATVSHGSGAVANVVVINITAIVVRLTNINLASVKVNVLDRRNNLRANVCVTSRTAT